MDGVTPLTLTMAKGEALRYPEFSTKALLSGGTVQRLVGIFSSIIRHHRMGARSEARQGGQIPPAELRDLLTGWAREVLPLLNLEVQRTGAFEPLHGPAVFAGNHLSYLDIPVLMSQVPVVFLGKEEISKWPVFGAAGRRAGMVFVKRESDGSRRQAVKAISECLASRGMSLGLFPSGTTSLDEARPWRTGAFKIARDAGFPVQPFRLSYEPVATAAFLGKDYLLPHLYRLLKAGPVVARIEFGAPRMVEDPEALARELWAWSRETRRS